jgi:uncharacterized protein YdaU (DUF1376 family)
MNFFKLYIGDYQRDTAHLSVTEHGAYMLMLQHYYATEKPLPTGKALHRMLRATDKAERDAIDSIASQFWRTTDAGLVNDRADQELHKASEQAETNRRIAVEREDARKRAREKHDQSTNRATNDEPNQTPDTRHHSVSETPRIQGNLLPSVGGCGAAPSAHAPPTPPPAFDGLNAEALNGKAVVPIAAGFQLPEDWGNDALALGFKATEALREAERFRQYWVSGKGAGTRRSVKGWRQTWSNWLDKAAKETR